MKLLRAIQCVLTAAVCVLCLSGNSGYIFMASALSETDINRNEKINLNDLCCPGEQPSHPSFNKLQKEFNKSSVVGKELNKYGCGSCNFYARENVCQLKVCAGFFNIGDSDLFFEDDDSLKKTTQTKFCETGSRRLLSTLNECCSELFYAKLTGTRSP